MPSQNACLPVRHTPVFCRTPLNKSSNFFSPPGSHTILVFFRTKRYGNIPAGTLLAWAKIAIFDQYLALGLTTAGASSVVNSNIDRAAKFITADADDNRHASVILVYDSKGSTSF